MLKKLLSLISITLILASCDPAKPISKTTDSSGVTVSLITKIEGCNVYAIDRGGIAKVVYTTICPHAEATTSYTNSCGKSCTTPVQVRTVRREDY